ncbi:pseudouridylate synthase 1 homolog [Ciona intestinalis]
MLRSALRNSLRRYRFTSIQKPNQLPTPYITPLTHLTMDATNITKIDDGIETKNSEGSEQNSGLVSGPKRKVAMLFAYCGANYHGLQMNRGERWIKTIEGDLFQALVNAKVVPSNCVQEPHKMTYKNASRTDKGVSTCGQVASLKLRLNENVVDLINQHLPEDIVVMAVRRTTQGFNAQLKAEGRTYSYTLPTFAFADYGTGNTSYKITEDKLLKVKSILHRYKGTHTFHNFTSGKRMGEMSAQRFIIEFEHGDPFLVQDVEFITLTIKGQSFMLHQIRKMIGLLIAMVNGLAKEQHFIRAFSEPLEDIPKAPGTGLVLEKVHYDGFNKGPAKQHGGVDFTDVQDKIDEFRKTRILPYIYKKEIEESSMLDWLETLSRHDYSGKSSKEQWEYQVKEWSKKKLENETKTNDTPESKQVESPVPPNDSKSTECLPLDGSKEESSLGKETNGTPESVKGESLVPPNDSKSTECPPLDGSKEDLSSDEETPVHDVTNGLNNDDCSFNKKHNEVMNEAIVTSEPAAKKTKISLT